MKCPECGAELPVTICSSCGEETPLEGKYCCNCGELLSTSTSPVEDDNPEDDFSNRVLCSDGSCIGVIGPDGKCRECGKPYTGPAE